MFSTKHKKKAFTLIEMLIVIVIIGIRAAALIPRLSSARGRANDVARKADLAQTAAALVAYQIDRGRFPNTGGALTVISSDLISAGMSSIPTDPNTSREFIGI
jgi:type II secretion system protein G